MAIVEDLDLVQVRVLGALLEKEQTTPEYYPLTVNALITACNQKSNRDPVTALSETEIVEALDSLAASTLVWRTDSARAERWRQSISRRLELDSEEKAILTLLLLRGPQTAGEVRSRSTRLHKFSGLKQIEDALGRMSEEERDIVVELARSPGQKENRWAHLLAGVPAPAATAEPVMVRQQESPAKPRLAERIEALESRVDELATVVERLCEQLGVTPE